MDVSTFDTVEPGSRVKRLRSATAAAHDQLDRRVMARQPFASLERYALFLEVQYRFHARVDPLYRDGAALGPVLPDLDGRRRLALIAQDLRDVTGRIPDAPTEGGEAIDPLAGLGWLYVAEGSNLGAAILLKEARKLGLSEAHGARHLAGHPDGRGLHWRQFTTALDRIALADDGEARAAAGAAEAFRYVHRLVGEAFGN
ncbi:biliverdin-producing heme oxygenase [Methylobacterium sp. J-077]|uniref:biliverdin-producing heme oxygenase n=1 Tax=Methylobacterium sp. J-077 TaxID=2836656 RepID=UPI001FBAFEA9|nr:biliverdin-producing heme oxygenase [Methylobacterium sp. J-077]MCJ2126151.1 biliverdin-producing heme oxygenase [Methylobacterium sp. J-077]